MRMMVRSKTVFKLTFILLTLPLSAAAQQLTAADGDTMYGLQLSFELTRDTFRQGDRIEYRLKLTNVGKDSITIHKNIRKAPYYTGLFIIVRDTEGTEIPRSMVPEPPSFLRPLKKEDFPQKDLVTLAPKESFSASSSIGVRNFFIKPGDYFITAEYHNPIPAQLAPDGLKMWGQNGEVLRTKPVKFKVIE